VVVPRPTATEAGLGLEDRSTARCSPPSVNSIVATLDPLSAAWSVSKVAVSDGRRLPRLGFCIDRGPTWTCGEGERIVMNEVGWERTCAHSIEDVFPQAYLAPFLVGTKSCFCIPAYVIDLRALWMLRDEPLSANLCANLCGSLNLPGSSNDPRIDYSGVAAERFRATAFKARVSQMKPAKHGGEAV
jgi:hypothetical protein